MSMAWSGEYHDPVPTQAEAAAGDPCILRDAFTVRRMRKRAKQVRPGAVGSRVQMSDQARQKRE